MLSVVAIASFSVAQPEPPNGPPANPTHVHALINARVIAGPGQSLDDATIVVRDGVIEAIGNGIRVPADARVWDLEGNTIHPGFIDLSVPVEGPASLPESPGLHWNARVHPQVNASDLAGLTESDAEALRESGFTAAMILPDAGIFRGRGAVVGTGTDRESKPTYVADGPFAMAFERSRWSERSYPGSLMGSIALVRQTLSDALWHDTCQVRYATAPAGLEPPEPAVALDALAPAVIDNVPMLFNTDSELDYFTVARLRDEFDINVMVRGNGNEFRWLDDVVATDIPIILPLNFPDAPKVESLEDTEGMSLRTLQAWEQSATNPRRLINAGATVALTTDRLDRPNDLFDAIDLAIKEGLTEDQALAALTTTPAALVGLDDVMGSIAVGKVANFVVIEGTESIFDPDRTVRSVWVNGRRHEVNPAPMVDPRGTWALTIGNGGQRYTLNIKGEADRPKASLEIDEDTTHKAGKTSMRMSRLHLVFPGEVFDRAGWERLAGVVEGDTMRGMGETEAGDVYHWTASRTEPFDEDADDDDDDSEIAEASPNGDHADMASSDDDADADKDEYEAAPESYPIPLGAYGLTEPAETPDVVFIDNATVWTSGPDGIIEDCDIVVRDGRFFKIGKDLPQPPNALVIDAEGKHVTPGLIDCHSHTGIDRGSINEGTQSVTAEVRIQDVITSDDIDWYRQLAGGLTAANQLHGSANPIGGQNSVVKLRWGGNPDVFRFEDAMPGIKFALGENVKQSNWGDGPTERYPRSRMGVEQVMRYSFQAARDYRAAWDAWNEDQSSYPPRRDYELDALVEILEGERLVHCHSYRQDEILMLIRVADDFGFTIGTFQHVLEGYKVAAEIAEHGAGASAFSDWWAYKFEVYDAIPYNGAIMHDVDVVVSYNSDSDELARRMNLEAAKAVRYGGVDPAEALKFVTLNPAKQLKIHDRVGSIEYGKDADFAIWSGDPLSTLSRCEQTWVDGTCRFSLESDLAARDYAKGERQRIIQKLLRKNMNGSGGGSDMASSSGRRRGVRRPPTGPQHDSLGFVQRDSTSGRMMLMGDLDFSCRSQLIFAGSGAELDASATFPCNCCLPFDVMREDEE